MKKVTDYTDKYPRWTADMKKTHKILVPNMLPWHFQIIEKVLKLDGFDIEILHNESKEVINEGLKHVHNDTCYPCLCVVGQYINALKSGKYDLDKTAVLITQTGGGCRASNYISLIKKALNSEFKQVPVVSVNFSNLEKESSLNISLRMFLRLAYCFIYGDTVMWCYNQTKPYEKEKGSADRARQRAVDFIVDKFAHRGYRKYKQINKKIIEIFASVPRTDERKVKVGVVGEIYVKYSSLGNNGLEKFLLEEGCEPVVPALLDFLLYCVVNVINEESIT